MADSSPIRADMLGRPDPKFRYRWERSFRDNAALASTTMLVGFALATWMDDDGTNAWPGLSKLTRATSLGERAVSKHLAALVDAGWLVRVRDGRKVGSGPNAYGLPAAYVASIPPGGTGVHPGTVPGGTTVQAGDSPAGTGVQAGISQGVVSGSQPVPDDVPGCTGVHPTEPPYRNETGAPLQYHLDAIKFGRELAATAENEEAVRSQWERHRTLSRFPALLDVVTDHWNRARNEERTA